MAGITPFPISKFEIPNPKFAILLSNSNFEFFLYLLLSSSKTSQSKTKLAAPSSDTTPCATPWWMGLDVLTFTRSNVPRFLVMKGSRSSSIFRIFLISGVFVILISLLRTFNAQSQSVGGNWSRPINLSDSEGQSSSPSITADPSGMVHLVWNEEVNADEKVILYSRLGNGTWSAPVDVFVNASGAPIIASNSQGYLHLVWSGAGGYLYSKVYAPLAGSAHYWSKPQVLVPSENYLGTYDLAVGEGQALGTICLTHAKQIGENSGVYLTCSLDNGNTWDERQLVYENLSPDRMVNNPRIAIGEDRGIHVVWVESNYPETFPPLGLRFASSKDHGETWSNVYSLADGPYADPEIIIRSNQEIHVVWSGTGDDRFKFHCWSKDEGFNWFPMWRNEEVGGLTGWPALVEDSVSRLHWIMVGDIFSLPEGSPKDALYYSVYNNNIWSPGEEVCRETIPEQNMRDVSAVVSLGNQLHVTVTSPVQAAVKSIVRLVSSKVMGGRLPPEMLWVSLYEDIAVRSREVTVPLACQTPVCSAV